MSIDVDRPVFLLGMPRSGTTWLSQIFESSPDVVVRLSPPYSYDYRHRIGIGSDTDEWRTTLRGVIDTEDKFLTQNWRRETGELPEFGQDKADAERLAIKDTRFHALYEAGMEALPGARTVYIVRNPGAALWSWRNCKEFPAGAEFREQWRTGACRKHDGDGEYWGFTDWLRLTTAYQQRAQAEPDRYLVVRYEDLVTHAMPTVERMFAFCELAVRTETIEFLGASQSSYDPRPYSVFKGRTLRDDWRHELPEDIYAAIEAETTTAGLGGMLS